MRIHTASRPRFVGALTGLCLLAALWSAPAAGAQVSVPGTDDVESQVEEAGDAVKDTVDDAVGEVQDTVEGAGDAVKNAVQDPVGTAQGATGTVEGATGTVTGAVEGTQEEAGGTTTATSAGSSTTAASAGSGTRERKKERRRPSHDRQRRGKKSATEANDVEELVSGGNEISGTEVAGTRISSGGEEGSGALSLTGAALLAYLVVGGALLSAGTVLVRWARGARGSVRLLEGPSR